MLIWFLTDNQQGNPVTAIDPNGNLMAQSINDANASDGSTGCVTSQIHPFQQHGSRAILVENLVVAAPDFKSSRSKLYAGALFRDSLHGRVYFPVISGLTIDLQRTCFRFLGESWLQFCFLRC